VCPASSGFSTRAEAEQFDEEGRSLAERLQSTLGDGYDVEYFPAGYVTGRD
jgi:hypothetical protein